MPAAAGPLGWVAAHRPLWWPGAQGQRPPDFHQGAPGEEPGVGPGCQSSGRNKVQAGPLSSLPMEPQLTDEETEAGRGRGSPEQLSLLGSGARDPILR